MADHQNLTVDQGSYWSQGILWKDAQGAPVDVTGYTARMKVREEIASAGDPIIELTTENSRITLGLVEETPGIPLYNILLEIATADTTTLPTFNEKKVWRYDLEMIPSNGNVKRLIQGKFVVQPEVTR